MASQSIVYDKVTVNKPDRKCPKSLKMWQIEGYREDITDGAIHGHEIIIYFMQVGEDKEKRMANKSNSSLAQQSKEWFLEALLKLMEHKKYEDITIKELALKAGLDRKTFYRNFDTKEDILNLYLDQTCKDYISNLRKEAVLTTYTVARAYFCTCKMHVDFLRLLDTNGLLPLLLTAFDKYLPELHKIFEDEQSASNPVYYSEYALSYFTGGFWNISIKWIRNGAKETPDEMAQIIDTLMSYPL